MTEQRLPFRFRLPWLTAVAAPRPPAAEPQISRPTTEIQASAQPATTTPIQRPPFRPARIAPPQPPPPQAPRIEPQTEPQAASESRFSSQPASPSRATQTRAASVPPSPSRGATETRLSSQPASPSRATTQTQVVLQTKSPSRPTTQPRAASVPLSPSRTASQTQSALQAGPQSQSSSRFPSRTTVQTSSQPSSPMHKASQLQPTATAVSQTPSSIPREQETKPAGTLQPAKEQQPKTQIKSEIVSESQYQTASENIFKRDRLESQPTQESDLVTTAAPTSVSESGKKAVEASVREGKPEDGKKVAVELVKEEDTSEAVNEEMRRTLTKLLTGASGSETQTRGFLNATFQTGKQQEQERKEPLSSDEKQIKTVSSTHLKDGNTQGNIHQKPDISHGERAPLHKEIKDDILKFAHKLASGHPKQPMDGKPVSIITLAGENKGASMLLGSESAKKEGSIHIQRSYKTNSNEIPESTTDGEESFKETIPKDPITKKDQATRVFINSNVQSINNSILLESSVNERNPGVELDFSHNLAEHTKSQPESIEIQKADFSITPAENLTYQPTIRRRCLRGLFMEPSDSDPDNPEKPRRHGCLYNCGEKSKDKDVGVL